MTSMIVACSNHGFNNWSMFEFPPTKTSTLKQKSVQCVSVACQTLVLVLVCPTNLADDIFNNIFVFVYITSSALGRTNSLCVKYDVAC